MLKVKNWSYGMFNSCRSALALIIPGDIGKNLTIRRFLKGISRKRPCKPKYNFVWDPKIVLTYLEKQYPHNELGERELGLKLVTLLMLATGHRLQTLAVIKVENIHFGEEGAQIFIIEPIKTSGPKAEQPCLFIPYFRENPRLCAGSLLLEYIERTALKRNEAQNLFISTREPFNSLSKQTLAKWVKIVLQRAGINTNLFSAHSARHASTSKAYLRGIPIDTIRKTAGWSSSSNTFLKFYNRPLHGNFNFARTVLSS